MVKILGVFNFILMAIFFLPLLFLFFKVWLFFIDYKLFYVIYFMLLFILNWLGLVGYVVSVTSNFLLVLVGALAGWGCLQISKCSTTKNFLAHFVPMGAPVLMLLFLFVIENISFIVQFLTLSVRLSANIITGHVLLGLVFHSFFISFTFISGLVVLLEMLVSSVQAVVFVMLLQHYSK